LFKPVYFEVMKKQFLFLMVFVFAMGMAMDGFSQRRPAGRQQIPARPVQQERMQARMDYCQNIPGLTEAQQEAIASLRAGRLEQGVQHRARMDALRSQKRELMVQASPDMARVNALIDEMESLRTAQLKEVAAHRQEIRKLLNDEQRAIFDSQAFRPSGRGGRGPAMRPQHRAGRAW
jgi:Spy/CpxP family protein refolding chaperone